MGRCDRNQIRPVCRRTAAGKLWEYKIQGICMIAAVMLAAVVFTKVFSSVYYLQLQQETGNVQNDWILNEAYAGSVRTDTCVLAVVACVLVLIMLCGYFIIYNIFHISITHDAGFYNSLSMRGYSRSEIHRLVKIKTHILCAVAILIGFVCSVV